MFGYQPFPAYRAGLSLRFSAGAPELVYPALPRLPVLSSVSNVRQVPKTCFFYFVFFLLGLL